MEFGNKVVDYAFKRVEGKLDQALLMQPISTGITVYKEVERPIIFLALLFFIFLKKNPMNSYMNLISTGINDKRTIDFLR